MFNGAQLHLMLNHLPIVGFILMVPVMILATLTQRTDYKKLALLGISVIALLTLPAFWTGEPAEEIVEDYPGVTKRAIHEHEEAAETGMILGLITGGIALGSWFMGRKSSAALKIGVPAATLGTLITAGTLAWAGHEGGKIRHPEIIGNSMQPSGEIKESKDHDNDGDDH